MKPTRYPLALVFVFAALLRTLSFAQTDLTIYDDALVNGWQNWSWAATDTASTAVVHSGTHSIAITASAWSALYLHHDPIDTHGYSNLVLWLNGGASGGQILRISALLSDSAQNGATVGPLAANTWQQIVLPLSALGASDKNDLTGIWVQEGTGNAQPTFYVDDMVLTSAAPPSTITINIDGNHPIATVSSRMFGVNAAIWDGVFNTSTTVNLLKEMDNRVLRYPGGSISDTYHWATNTTEGQTFQWATNPDEFARTAAGSGAQVIITANYGTGTPQEAAAWVQDANKKKHYGFKYWEIGNENYGSWEADNNTRPHDPVTYATRFKTYWQQMKAVDPSIKIGAVAITGEDSYSNYTDHPATNPRTNQTHNGWTPVMLATMKSLGVTPDFIVYHRYAQAPWGENDSYLLTSSASWANDAANLRQMLNDYLGTAGAKVELACTENNSVYSNPGKQTTSLVNGLFYADSLGTLLKTEFKMFVWWDFRNGQETGNNNSPSLYGWRQYGDYGMVDSADPAKPADRYPTFYVAKLLKHFARGGEQVLNATSDYVGVAAYAAREPNGSLRIMLINKHPTSPLTVNVKVNGLTISKKALIYRYGIAQDEAAHSGVGSADIRVTSQTLPGSTFSYTTDPYSVTILRMDR
jgi:alpha-N-arabinofuranosidase